MPRRTVVRDKVQQFPQTTPSRRGQIRSLVYPPDHVSVLTLYLTTRGSVTGNSCHVTQHNWFVNITWPISRMLLLKIRYEQLLAVPAPRPRGNTLSATVSSGLDEGLCSCLACGKTFTTAEFLQQHIVRKHPQQVGPTDITAAR